MAVNWTARTTSKMRMVRFPRTRSPTHTRLLLLRRSAIGSRPREKLCNLPYRGDQDVISGPGFQVDLCMAPDYLRLSCVFMGNPAAVVIGPFPDRVIMLGVAGESGDDFKRTVVTFDQLMPFRPGRSVSCPRSLAAPISPATAQAD
ncbi:unnamed protein product (mitochondrion) [Plasmodiophora brassicae]|uniref:Uncharacterized protein n=1 Tax=Plasmodiophora brassicae TaxID=37360 RepID=A0A3P3Y4N2_PLABS|nr:unnamed protein product [Plasmodiophora brassicae]